MSPKLLSKHMQPLACPTTATIRISDRAIVYSPGCSAIAAAPCGWLTLTTRGNGGCSQCSLTSDSARRSLRGDSLLTVGHRAGPSPAVYWHATGSSPGCGLSWMPVRNVFHRQLDDLKAGIAGLCERTGIAMANATDALLQPNLQIAEEVIGRYDDITHECTRLETDAFTILARQAPVAGDLRAVVSSLKDVADMQRMGALATHIARIARRRHPHVAVPADVVSYFAEMGRIAVRISEDTKSVVLSGDPEQAAQLHADDDAMDDLHKHLFTRVMDPDWSHGTATAVDVTLLSRYYERFADHAVEVADRVIYQTTGTRQA